VLFSADKHAGLADGSITLTFRTWRRPLVRVGGRHHVGGLTLVVDELARMNATEISDSDARAAGFADGAALRARLGNAEEVWRVAFHCDGADERIALRTDDALTDDVLATITVRLDRLDRTSPHGAWTRATLELIAARPGVVSTELAGTLGRERFSFKTDVRKLKALGLTESLEVGYRLSPRGRAFLARPRDE
jgi:hypothetical protein